MNTIVAVRRGGLGDLLIAAPSIHLLRLAFPEARITLVSHLRYGRLLQEAGIVDDVEDAEDFTWACLSGPGPVPPPALAGADLVAGWFHSKSADAFLNGVAGLQPERPVLAFRADPLAGESYARRFFSQTREFCGEANRPSFSFERCARLRRPSAPLPSAAAGLSRPYAVVHPGGGSPNKLWPGDRFRDVIRAAAGRGCVGAVVLGEAEEGLREEWGSASLPPGWILLDRPSLFSLAALLSGATAYLGNDSGVTHLAAALGPPGLAVFRSEFLPAWRPFGKITTVDAPDVREIRVADVASRINFA
jgi:ADP-heptose:LPS heptosyltransferase